MWKLEIYRVITSIGGWIKAGEYPSVDLALEGILHTGYALEYRIVSPEGNYHEVEWVDHTDSMGCDYCLPILGKVCSHWPQVVGDIRKTKSQTVKEFLAEEYAEHRQRGEFRDF